MKLSAMMVFGPEKAREYDPLCFGCLDSCLKKYRRGMEVIERNTVGEILDAAPDVVVISAVTEHFDLAVSLASKVRDSLGLPSVSVISVGSRLEN